MRCPSASRGGRSVGQKTVLHEQLLRLLLGTLASENILNEVLSSLAWQITSVGYGVHKRKRRQTL